MKTLQFQHRLDLCSRLKKRVKITLKFNSPESLAMNCNLPAPVKFIIFLVFLIPAIVVALVEAICKGLLSYFDSLTTSYNLIKKFYADLMNGPQQDEHDDMWNHR